MALTLVACTKQRLQELQLPETCIAQDALIEKHWAVIILSINSWTTYEGLSSEPTQRSQPSLSLAQRPIQSQ